MRPPLPTLGPQPKKSPLGPVLVISLVLGLVVGGVWWWNNRSPSAPAEPVAAMAPVDPSPSETLAAMAPTALPAPTPGGGLAPAGGVPPTVLQATAPTGMSHVTVRIEGPLETALVAAAGASVGPALAQVVTRTLVWWVDVPGDLRRGDSLDILYETRATEEPLVHAVRFSSGKTGQTHRAYRFQASGDKAPRYYQPGGEELELRLEGSPLDDYEQVTSLLRDGRKHKGVDFKTAVGTPVKAPFTGIVKRKNWSFRFNGNCVELEEVGGKHRRALFLHMDELPRSLKVGDRIAAGTVVGRSGNSGRSFAPHLHYQLEAQNDRVLDPYESHRTYRRSLATAQRASFEAEMRRQDALFGTTVVAGAGAGH
ncbi:peptidoglycan DD-metalloendopeptidase family protein [Archangium primigenium]|nr:M23 family metallopeptidase [Archangium primigenium]MBM7116728.1 peptidoglycan DD-metalloendopeptidase family protein [Archangium primigenium]